MDTRKTRRVVIGPGGGDGARIEMDGEVPTVIETPELVVPELWLTKADSTSRVSSDPTEGPWSLEPPPGGTTFRLVEFRPQPNASEAEITGAMHATETIDYGTIISGSVSLFLPDGAEINLRAGECFVLRGVQHGWVNKGNEPCVASVVLVSTKTQ